MLDRLGIEIYGDRPDFDIAKIPSVIAATRLYRPDGLLSTEVVISHTGYEDVLVTLDTADGSIYEVGFPDQRTKVADSFGRWLAEMVKRNASS